MAVIFEVIKIRTVQIVTTIRGKIFVYISKKIGLKFSEINIEIVIAEGPIINGIDIGKIQHTPIGFGIVIGKIQCITIGFAIGIGKVDLSAIGIGIDYQLLDFPIPIPIPISRVCLSPIPIPIPIIGKRPIPIPVSIVLIISGLNL